MAGIEFPGVTCGEDAAHLVTLLGELQIPIQSAGISGIGGLPIDSCCDNPNAGIARQYILRDSADEVVRQGFNQMLPGAPLFLTAGPNLCVFGGSDCLDDAEGGFALRSADNLRRAEDSCRLGTTQLFNTVGDVKVPRLPSDAPGVKEGVIVYTEHGRAFDKEGTAFLKILFISGEIESGRVCLYLSKVRIHRGVEGDAGGDAILDIGADISPEGRLAIQRPPHCGCPPHCVRHHFQMARRTDSLDTAQLAHSREPVRFRFLNETPVRVLFFAAEFARDMQSPDVFVLRGEA